MARPLFALSVLSKVAPPDASVRAADASVVLPSALTAPVKLAKAVPALTFNWKVPPATLLAKFIAEFVDWTVRSAARVTGLLNVMAPAAVLVTLVLSVIPVPLTVLAV